MENTQALEKNISKFTIFQTLRNISFFLPIIVLFWESHGLSMTDIMLLQSLFSVCTIILEVPAGYFADRIGRKPTLVMSSVFFLFAGIIYSQASSWNGFLLAEIIWAFGISFLSGTDSAFLYDTLLSLRREQEYKKIFGKALFMMFIGMGISNILGGFIGAYDYRMTFYAGIPFALYLVFLSLSFIEPPRQKRLVSASYFTDFFDIIKNSFLKNRKLFVFILYSGIVYTGFQSVLFLYQPYFSFINIPIHFFGFILALCQIFGAISSKYAHNVTEYFGKTRSLYFLIFVTALSYFLMANVVFIWSIIFIFLQQVIRGVSKVFLDDLLNAEVSSDIRSTILSLQHMVSRFFYAFVLPIIGYIVDNFSLLFALNVMSVSLFVIGTLWFLLLKKVRVC